MKYRFDGFNHLLRLEKGELLMESLVEFAKINNLETGWVMGLGACRWAELGFYNLETKSYTWQKFDQPMEIVNLQGNIALKDGQPFAHIHAVLSNNDFQSVAGHVKELEVNATCEIFFHHWFKDGINRKPDENIGLPLLDL